MTFSPTIASSAFYQVDIERPNGYSNLGDDVDDALGPCSLYSASVAAHEKQGGTSTAGLLSSST